MKKKYFLPIILFTILAAGCTKDFLNRTPLDSFDDSNFWTNETNIRLHSMYYYASYFRGYGNSGGSGWDVIGLFNRSSYATDYVINTGGVPKSTFPFTNGYSAGFSDAQSVAATAYSSESWANNYIWIRRANTFIKRMEEQAVDYLETEAYEHWLGVARFLRGERLADLVWGYGDVPLFTSVPSENLDELCKDRDNRYDVLEVAISDYQYAIDHCRADDGANNLINRFVVAHAGARRMLHIGLYNKYVPAEYQGGNAEKAKQYLEQAVKWTEVVMNEGNYSIQTDYRSVFSSFDLSTNKEIILGRYYAQNQLKHCQASYQNYNEGQTQWGGTPGAHFIRNFVLFWDGELDPALTTVAGAPEDSEERYDQLYTMLDNTLFKNKDPRLEAMLKSSRVLNTGAVNGGAWSAPYANKSATRYYVRNIIPRDLENLTAAEAASTDATKGAVNYENAPVYRYAETLLNWITAKAELADSGWGPAITQGDLDKSINAIRDRPIANTAAKNPSMCEHKLAHLTLGQYPNDPTRDPDVSPLLWEIRRERAVELMWDNIRSKDLRAYGKYLTYIYRFDKYPGKYNREPADPNSDYDGQLYYGGDPVNGWGLTDLEGVQYFKDLPEGNLMQCGAYFALDKLFDKMNASYQAWKADPNNKVKQYQYNEDKVAWDAFAAQKPKLWVVTKDGEQRKWPNYLVKEDNGQLKFFTTNGYSVATADYTVPVDDATARASMERMRGWFIVGQHTLSDCLQAANQRMWLACVPIGQITYYETRGYTLTQNPGWPTQL